MKKKEHYAMRAYKQEKSLLKEDKGMGYRLINKSK